MGKFVTITEIAKLLNISHSTVSRALSGNKRISAETTKKVLTMAESLGYQNNSVANYLSQKESKLIGLIVPDITIFFFAKVAETIQDMLEKEGYQILLFNSSESMDKEVTAINNCINRRVDGVIAAITQLTTSYDHYQKLIRYEIPLVFFDRVVNALPVPKVITNDYQAAYDATKYMLASGCKRIAHITASINLNNSNNRLYGYMDALRDHHVEIEEDLIHYYEFDTSSIDLFLSKTLDTYPDLDGLFVFNDYVANYAVNALYKLGKRIPDEISVIGFSDEPIATYMSPQLSSVQQTASQLAQLTSEKIINILKGNEQMVDEKIVVNPELVIRGTTK